MSDVFKCSLFVLSGKRQNAPTFHYGLPEKMFVSISQHIKNIHGVRKDKKQGVRDENYLVDRNEQHNFFGKKPEICVEFGMRITGRS